MKREVKIKSLVLFSGLLGILLLSVVSAGWFDWLKSSVTGKDTYRPTNVSVTVVGADMVSIIVHNETLTGAVVQLTEEEPINISFVMTVSDANGANDINTSSVKADFVKPNEPTRSNSSCIEIGGQSTSLSRNFSCTIEMWYFDGSGGWTINASARDLGNTTVNTSTYYNFSLQQLQAIKIDPDEIFWSSVVAGSINQTASNNTRINNTGNYNMTSKIQVNATNLYSGANVLDVGNVSVSVDTGGDLECNGTLMVNAEDTAVQGIVLEKGNLTAGQAYELVYYCLVDVPANLPTGTYDTTTEGSWTISLF